MSVAGWRRDQVTMPEISQTLTLYIHFGNSLVDNPRILPSCCHSIALSCSASWIAWEDSRTRGVGGGLGRGDAGPEQWTRLHYFLFLMVYFLQSNFLTAFTCGFLKCIGFISSTTLNKPKGLKDFCSFLTLDRFESWTHAFLFNETIYN